jgi:hypothetical protein
MPRAKQPTLGAYPNRTDLAAADTGKQLAVQGIPGGQYGDEARQESEQRAVPQGSTPVPTTPSAAVATATGGGGSPVGGGASPVPNQLPEPGSLPFLHPTNRPNEPVTAGLSFGPGAGPSALRNPPPLVADTLESLAAAPNASSRVQQLAQYARSLGI